VTVFLDSSAVLAACWSAKGLSHVLIERAPHEGWKLFTADYCVAEVEANLAKHPAGPTRWRTTIRPRLEVVRSIYVLDRPIVFDARKDKPVLISAIGSDADYLVTLDRTDFGHVLGSVVYGVKVRTPKTFLLELGLIEPL
jgi:predicted nucleic acid-binding protein